MFNPTYIYELRKGQLTENGYKHFLSAISWYVKKFNWPKTIVISKENSNTKFWSQDDIKELSHQFFEWIISKDKLEYLNKIPESYLSYYFSQMLISLVANRIKEKQQKEGLSFEKTSELVTEIANKELIKNKIKGVDYFFDRSFNENDVKPQNEIENSISYLSKIPITENTKHFKPLVKIAIEDIFNTIESPITLKKLIEYVFALFDQKDFASKVSITETGEIEIEETENLMHKKAINNILSNLTKTDARLFSEYIFHSQGEMSLSELAAKYKIPKSTLHHLMENFRKKIATSYMIDNEDDGLIFIKKLAMALDERSN